MCVIILAEHGRPSPKMLDQAWTMNRDGGGMCWREPDPTDPSKVQVVWKKGLTLDEVQELNKNVPLPFVIHMRIASVDGGGVHKNLTHPFEVSEHASIALEGRTANPVLFHNGNWKNWEERALEVAIKSRVGVPTGRWSDSRAMAWLSHVCGYGFMNFLPDQRGLMFGTSWYNVFNGPGWERVKDDTGVEFWCSNRRPWMNAFKYNEHQVCKFSKCQRHDLNSQGWCPDHPGGREKLSDMIKDMCPPVVVPGGATTTPPPFLSQGSLQGTVPLLTQSLAEKFYNEGKISHNMAKGLRQIFKRLESKDAAVQRRAQVNLRNVHQAVAVKRALSAEFP